MNGKNHLRSIVVFSLLAIVSVLFSATRPLAAEANAFSLTLNVSPAGSGTAVANPGPPYSQNQVVTLTATPNNGYVFDRWVLGDDSKWWDAGWDYRVEVTANAAGYARKNKPAEFDLNFTQLWSTLGASGTLDPNSIRVVEVDGNDNVIDADVPFQFDRAADFNAATKAAGTVVVIMEGNTAAGATRTYHVYFDVTGKGFPAPNVTPQVVLSEQADESIAAFKIETATGTLFIHKPGGGVSSYNDLNGNDWVSWNSASGSAGAFRGIPNAVGGNNSGFHPGKGPMTGTILSQGPIKTTLHFRLTKAGSCDKERWEGIFEIYPNYSTFTMLQACVSSAINYPFWLLYEGTPGGKLDPATDYVVFSNGTQINAGQTRNGDLPNEEWAYVVDPNVGGAGRAIFLANHKDDTQNDTYYPDNAKVMTILGFGRNGSSLLIPGTSVPHSLTFGLMDETAIDNAKPVIYNAYRDLNTSIGNAQARSGASLGTQNPVQFTITGEHTIIAQFKPAQYTVNFTVTPEGTGTVAKSPNKATYNFGEQVTLTAAPTAPGFFFGNWSGDASGTDNPVTVTVTKNMNVVATFVQAYTVNATASPLEGGTVLLSPPGPTYAPGTEVNVTAAANNGYSFIGWEGGTLTGSNPIETITVNSNVNIVAKFAQPQFTFSATSAGNGSVDWTPKKAAYAAGEQIIVTATPNTGYAFENWTGSLTSTVNPLTFPITGNTSLIANFVETQLFTLAVSVPGGGGTVTKDPDQASYQAGATVTLTAVPDSGKQFIQWGGDAGGTNPVTHITMTGNKVVTAQFADEGEPLTITISPPQGGTVTKQPDQEYYLPGTQVTLTAQPNTGWTFDGWSGDATGTELTTVVTIGPSGSNVTAAFSAPGPFTLTTSTAGSGSGTITINPQKAEYAFGDVVKLTAVPSNGSTFAGWSGDAVGTNNPINVTMNGDKNIVATFILPTGPYTDQFDTCSLDAKWGSPIDPAGDGAFKVNGKQLLITVPEGATHNLWTDNKNAPRVMQTADNVDFEYIVKFDSAVTQTAQMQGIIIEQDEQNFARFDFEYNDGMKAYAATFADGASRRRISIDINAADAVYLRVMRVGVRWFMYYSPNGETWTEAGSFNNYVLNVTKAGVFAGNVAMKGQPAPAHTAVVDFFRNKAHGPLPADRPLLSVTTIGSGSVTTNPPIDQLTCGGTVNLTANPGFGSTFTGWSGDITGAQSSVSLLITGPKQVTATFGGSAMRFIALPVIIR